MQSHTDSSLAPVSSYADDMFLFLKLAIVGMGALTLGSLAAGAQVWVHPFPRAMFMTMFVSFATAMIWAVGVYLAARAFLVSLQRGARPRWYIFTLVWGVTCLYACVAYLWVGTAAISAFGGCVRAAGNWWCDVSVTNPLTAEQKQALDAILAKLTRMPWPFR